MSKKQLLTESEVRRFMALANLPAIGRTVVKEQYGVGGSEGQGEQEVEESMYETPPEAEEGEESEAPSAEGDKSERLADIFQQIADVANVKIAIDKGEDAAGDMSDLDIEDSEEDGGEEAPPPRDSEDDEEEDDEEEEEEEEEDDEEEDELEEFQDPSLNEAIVEKILNRVTTRLTLEARQAKKNGKDVLKGESKPEKNGSKVREKMKAMKKKAKLKEANAAAPKASHSNGPKKGAGSASKGTFGTSNPQPDQNFEKGLNKKGMKYEKMSASSEHMKTHGKVNLATKG